MVSYCVFDFHFPNDVILKHLFVLIGHVYIFGEIHIHIFCPFLVVFCGYLKFYIYILVVNIFLDMYFTNVLIHSISCFFNLLCSDVFKFESTIYFFKFI